jgi:hypothetical protein
MIEARKAGSERIVFGQTSVFMIVEPGTPHAFIIQLESERSNQMQAAPGIRTKAYDISGVRRNFGFEQDQVKH